MRQLPFSSLLVVFVAVLVSLLPPTACLGDAIPRLNRRKMGGLTGMGPASQLQTCPDGKILVHGPLSVSSNGCGSAGMSISTGSDDFTPCCDQHDACYSICGATKNMCEVKFKKCLNSICETSSDQSSCQSNVALFTMGAAMMGGSAFEQAQQDSCKCMQPDQVVPHYKKLSESIVKRIYTLPPRQKVKVRIAEKKLEKLRKADSVVEVSELRTIANDLVEIYNTFPGLIVKEKTHPKYDPTEYNEL